MMYNHVRQRMLTTRIISCVAALAMSGCATIVTGTTQSVAFNSQPQGAYCELQRNGAMLSQFTTPAVTTVTKGNHDLNVTCRKESFAPFVGAVPSDLNGWIFGNIIFGGLAGIGIDLVTGADESYPPVVTVDLHAETPLPPSNASLRIGPFLSAK